MAFSFTSCEKQAAAKKQAIMLNRTFFMDVLDTKLRAQITIKMAKV
jgi:hypothetical protein